MKKLAIKIYEKLNSNGAELGNASIVLINKVLKDELMDKLKEISLSNDNITPFSDVFETTLKGGYNLALKDVEKAEIEDSITVTEDGERDILSTKLNVKIIKNGLGYNASGHINNRTNRVQLSPNEEIDEVGMEEARIDLEDIEVKIENREIKIQ